MKIIKRYTIFLLVFILLTLNIFTAYAGDIADINGGGYGGNTAPSTEAWIGRYHALQENNGIRLFLVDTSGVIVSNQVDLVNYYPEKIDGFDSELANIYHKYYNWTGYTEGREKQFRYWSGFKYDSVYFGSTKDLHYGYSNTKGSKGSTSDRQDPVSQKVYTYEVFEAFFEKDYSIDFPNAVSPISRNGGTIETTDFRTGETVSIPRDLQGPVQRLADGSGQEGTGDIFVNQLYTKCEDGDPVLLRIIDMQMPVLDIHGEEKGGLEPLFNFVYEDDIALLNELNSVDGKNHIVDVVKQKNYKLCGEVLHWAVNEVVLPTAPNGLNGVDLNAFYHTPCIEYGTVSQISFLTYNWLWDATKAWLQLNGWYTTDEAVTAYISQAGQSWDWSLAYTAYMLDKTDTDLGIYSFYDCGIDPDTAEQQRLKFWHDYAGNLGYGIIVTDVNAGKDSGTSTSTYDELTYGPDTPSGYSPGPSEDKSTDGGYTLKNNIVKFYANKYSNTSYDYLENHTRTDTVSKILLENEPGYTVDDWFASSEFKQPTSPTDSYSDVKSSLPNKQSGGADANKTVTLDAKDTLYVRLVKTPLVIKIYESNGTVDKIVTEQNPTINNNQYDVKDPDGDYEYTESLISNKPSVNPDTWNDCIGDPSESDPISISPDTVVIYIHYVKESPLTDSGLVLHENEISHNFSLSDITGELMSCTRHYKYVSVPECGYFYDCGCSSDDDDCDCWSCDASMNEDDAGTYSFDVVNRPSYNVQFVYKWTQSNTHYSGDGEGHSGFEVEAQPDMKFTLSRAYADKPTLYPGLNSGSAKTALTEMGITSEGYKPAGTRYGNKSEQSRRLNWTTTFTTHWTYENVDNPDIEFEHGGHDEKSKSQSSYDGSYTETYNSSSVYSIGQIKTYSSYYKVWDGSSWVYFRKSTYGSKSKAYTAAKEFAQELTTNSSSSATGGISSLNSSYSQSNNTTIYGLWGKPNTGTTAPTDKVTSNKWTLNNMTFTSRRSTIESTANITFYPYYKMVYQTLNTSDKDVYLTSENISTLLNLQRVDTAIYKTNAKPSLYLQSYQWSVHARIQNNLSSYNILDKDSFLPAGAIYSLATGQDNNANDVYVGFRIFSTYVSDKAALANSDSSILNKSEAQTKINNFITQSKNILDNYEITMNGATGIYVDSDNFFDKATQLTGQYGTYKIANQKFDSDSKYDLQSNGSGASRADIDILDEKSQQYIWTLKADAEGNITVYKDNQLLETIKKSSTSISNSSVKEFNERTNLVTNFINALDRNLGSDRSGKAWYNEGFEINCIEHQQAFKLGFGGTDTLRSAALNIKANGYLSDRSDMYNLDQDTINEKARTYKFYTSQKSTVSEASSHSVGWVGNFGNTEVIIPGIHEMFTSKLFYTSNTTVQDLN